MKCLTGVFSNVWILILCSIPSVSRAQENIFEVPRAAAGAGVDSVVVAASVNPSWKGFLLGSWGPRVFVDYRLFDQHVTNAGDWRMAFSLMQPRFAPRGLRLVPEDIGGLEVF